MVTYCLDDTFVCAQARGHHGTDLRVPGHQHPLRMGEAGRAGQEFLGDRRLAEVVHGAGNAAALDLRRMQPESRRDALRRAADVRGVKAQITKLCRPEEIGGIADETLESIDRAAAGRGVQDRVDLDHIPTGGRDFEFAGHVERRFGEFHRTVTLSRKLDANKAEASYADGVLTIRIPRSEEAKPRELEIS